MGLSRNKVAVPEGAAGSPPFYGEFGRMFVRRCVPPGPGGPAGRGLLVWKMVVGLWVRPSWGGPWGGAGMLLGSRTATPGLVSRRGLSAPRDRRRVGSRAVGSAGAWWFENWIVDASGRTPLLVFSCSVISMTPAGFLLLLVVGFCLIVL